jgi:hypothetical protein
MAVRWKRILKYWQAASAESPQEADVTRQHLHVDGPILELYSEDGLLVQRFGPTLKPYDCWALELCSWEECDEVVSGSSLDVLEQLSDPRLYC